MPADLQSIIHEIYRQAKELGLLPPNATRLVKLVYLSDLEWRRNHGGEPLCDLRWRFHHYGPYADEFSPILGGDNVEVVELTEGKTAKALLLDWESQDQPPLTENITAQIRHIVKDWGDSNLNVLLNHVYFNTEPMENAKRGEPLDFSSVRPLRKVSLNLNKAAVSAIRSELSKNVQRLGLTREGIHSPAVDLGGESAWDENSATPRLPPGTIVKF